MNRIGYQELQLIKLTLCSRVLTEKLTVTQLVATFYGTRNFITVTQIYPFYTFLSYFPKIHFNIILLCAPRSSEWSVTFRFSDQNFVQCKTGLKLKFGTKGLEDK